MTRDEFRQRLEDVAYSVHRAATNEMSDTPWLFWVVVSLALMPVVALLWWIL